MQAVLVVIFTIGLIICQSSDSYFGIWVGLEVCGLCVFPWLVEENSEVMYSAVFKYFVIQAVSSVLLCFGAIIIWGFWGIDCGIYLCILGLMLKVGGIFTGVITSFIESLSWLGVSIVLGVQKIPLLAMLVGVSEWASGYMMVLLGLVVGVFSVWVCGVVSLRSFIVLSSVLNMGWFFSALGGDLVVATGYFVIYLLCFLMVCTLFYIRNSIDSRAVCYSSGCITLVESTALLVISGLPPFAVFFSKVSVLITLVSEGFLLECWFLVILSTFMVYVYVNIAVGSLFLGLIYGIEGYKKSARLECLILMCLLSVVWCIV